MAWNLAQMLKLFTTIVVRYKFLKLNVPGKKVILSTSSPWEEIWVKSLRWQISSINYGQCNSIGELGVGFYHDQ